MAKQIKVLVTDPVGLYATPATTLVNSIKAFYSDITLTYNEKTVNLKSMMGVLSLGIPSKAHLLINIDGPDEEMVETKLSKLIAELEIGVVE